MSRNFFLIIKKNHAADPEKGFLTKSISKPNGRATAMLTAWELIIRNLTNLVSRLDANSFNYINYFYSNRFRSIYLGNQRNSDSMRVEKVTKQTDAMKIFRL